MPSTQHSGLSTQDSPVPSIPESLNPSFPAPLRDAARQAQRIALATPYSFQL